MKLWPATQYAEGIQQGDRLSLSRAITLSESALPQHQALAHEVMLLLREAHAAHAGKTLRLGITGVPGVGKSTFIETLGLQLVNAGLQVAVLPVDPTSPVSHGALLGDKTRMEELSRHPGVYIRPSPTGQTLGGVAARTREAIFLCEAAGFDIVIVETVGVGQSEVTVRNLVDLFLLLLLPGAGDELQGMKRGIMEMADALVINKVEEHNQLAGRQARVAYQNALHLFPLPPSGQPVPVMMASALQPPSVQVVWDQLRALQTNMQANGWWQQQRQKQHLHALHQLVQERALQQYFSQHDAAIKAAEQAVQSGLLPSIAVDNLP